MSGTVPFDWQSPAPDAAFEWVKSGCFQDGDGVAGGIGSRIQLCRPAICFDEKGGRIGLFRAGETFAVDCISSVEPALLYIEGTGSAGWYGMAGVQPADTKIVTD